VDSVKLRNELRRIVAWIDSLPLQPPAPPPPPAREEDSQEQPPPPPDSPPLSPPTLPLSTVQNPATPVLSNALRPVCELPASPSPPCPSSPPGPASPMCIYTVIDDAHNSYYDSEEGEDTGSAPIYGTSTTSGESQNYNAAQAHKAFNALLDDGDSDVDEPLPSSAPHRSEEDEAPVGSFCHHHHHRLHHHLDLLLLFPMMKSHLSIHRPKLPYLLEVILHQRCTRMYNINLSS
jgi:hypothetical protein